MKNIIFLGLTLFFALIIKAQPSTIPVENKITFFNSQISIPDDTYLKDVNHLFDKYIGTWKGIYNNRNYTFIITKETHAYRGLLEDRLIMRYTITGINGTIIEDTSTLLNESPFVIKGYIFNEITTQYILNYTGKNYKCGQSGQINISVNNLSQMKLNYFPDNNMIDDVDCPNLVGAEEIMPENGIWLIKQ